MHHMDTLYRRHSATCPHKAKSRTFHRCKCPIWVDNGRSGDACVRRSLKTNVWTRAVEMVEDIRRGVDAKQFRLTAVADACERYLRDCEGRRLNEKTIRKARSILVGSSVVRMAESRKAPSLVAWANSNGVRWMQDFDLERLEAYRAAWKDAPLTAGKRLDQVRAFFGWAQKNGMCRANYAADVRRPKPKQAPTLPYSDDEFQRLLDGCMLSKANEPHTTAIYRTRLRLLLLVMRYTGLRISDALQLDESHLEGCRVRLYQHKTGEHVHVPLPKWLAAALEACPKAGPVRWFMAPNQTIKNAHEQWRRKLAKLATDVGVKKPGFHRLRDTFAVGLLLQGVSLDMVSVLLGHTSVKMTEKHYAPWVRDRQRKLDETVIGALAGDVVAQREELMALGAGRKN